VPELETQVETFFDSETSTLSYVVWKKATPDCVIIDPVLNYEQSSSKTTDRSLQEILVFLKANGLKPLYILETHAHADHLSGSQYLKNAFPNSQIGIGARIDQVQKLFKDFYELPSGFKTDGSQFDRLFADNEKVKAGELEFQVLSIPGHTPACVAYYFANLETGAGLVFVGDSLFMPDYGTGRCDFPGGSADALYDSIQQTIYRLPDKVRIFTGHDYQPNGRKLRFEATVAEQKSENIHLKSNTTKKDFVTFRTARDKTLATPKLLLPSVQVNIDAGRLPSSDARGRRFLKIPIS
jgi:glyoxylase-like metal-dependent hydrolase (beta-lactamase superfamily II)